MFAAAGDMEVGVGVDASGADLTGALFDAANGALLGPLFTESDRASQGSLNHRSRLDRRELDSSGIEPEVDRHDEEPRPKLWSTRHLLVVLGSSAMSSSCRSSTSLDAPLHPPGVGCARYPSPRFHSIDLAWTQYRRRVPRASAQYLGWVVAGADDGQCNAEGAQDAADSDGLPRPWRPAPLHSCGRDCSATRRLCVSVADLAASEKPWSRKLTKCLPTGFRVCRRKR